MTCPAARTGRHRQRYDEDQFRLVAGCIPYKFEKGVDQNNYNFNPNKRLRVLMISTPNREDLVFPKGGWENDEEIKDAACREALEEAGVKGKLTDEPLGVWEFRSKSREKKSSGSVGGGCRGHMYALEVTQQLDSWPEKDIYVRKWLTVDEAFEVCRYDWMREALEKLLILLSKNERETGECVGLHKPLLLPHSNDNQNIFSPACFGKSSGVLCLDKRNCPFGITTYFPGFIAFLLKCGSLFSTFRSISYLERKAGVHKRKPNGP